MRTQKRCTTFWILTLVPAMLHASPSKIDLDELQKALDIPMSIAKVSDGQMPPDARFPQIILVQDIHRHPEVQGHIAALLLHGVRHWGLKEVYLEGARAEMPVARPAESSLNSLREALEEGRLGGAEMAVALEPDSPLELRGLEDSELYRENVAAYEQVDASRESALRELETAHLLETSLDMNTGTPGHERWDLLQKMLQLRLKPADYAVYRDHPYTGLEGSALNEAIRAAERFYSLADERSRFFLKILATASGDGPQLIVVGGYHTAMMAEELRRQGKSFAVLTPDVTQGGYDGLYVRGMQETISALKLQEAVRSSASAE